MDKKIVVVAMSGGVDSSVAAALLVEQGYSVIGMMLRLWSEQDAYRSNRCCTPDSIAQARQVASLLSIPFYVLDAKQLFYETVVQPFIVDYTHNQTPNPCINCNRTIRWNFLYHQARSAGAEYLATGHYARIQKNTSGNLQLLRGADPAKDQSYVLHILTQDHLNHALFPLGDYTKPEVRQMASNFHLPVAERRDSQDLCFIGGDGDYRQFLARHVPDSLKPGLIQDQQGNILGRHHGLVSYTIGQRKGINISSPTPLYVIEKDIEKNTLIVGSRDQSGRSSLKIKEVNWVEGFPPGNSFDAQVKIRYQSQSIPCFVTCLKDSQASIEFDRMVNDITPGQAAVLYNGDTCLGGGIIT